MLSWEQRLLSLRNLGSRGRPHPLACPAVGARHVASGVCSQVRVAVRLLNATGPRTSPTEATICATLMLNLLRVGPLLVEVLSLTGTPGGHHSL